MRHRKDSTIALVAVSLALATPAAAQTPAQDAAPAAQPEAVSPPQLRAFAEAEFPPDALAQGVAGSVILLLDIDAEGNVTNAVVREGAGHGFDEAAAAAALRFKFTPATRDGKPVASRILYRYRFEYREPAKPPADEPANAPSAAPSGAKGRVRMSGSDTPLAGARVTIRAADGRSINVTTDEEGRWSAADLPPGRLTLSISAPGFSPVTDEQTLAQGEEMDATYRLSPEGGPLEVVVRGDRPDREITKRSIARGELTLVPGTGGDALRAVQTMPGVARTFAFDGLIVVRGSSPTGTSVFIDGTWTPNLYHFGGLSSIVPTEMIESLDFYPGNFSAMYGRATGGIIDVKLREVAPDGKYHGLAQVDLIDARLWATGPIPLLDGWKLVVAGRRSHIDAWLPSLVESADLNIRSAPVYYDYQAFAETKPSQDARFRIGIFGQDDRLEMVLGQAISADPGIGAGFDIGSSFWQVQALYQSKISKDLSVSATAAYGHLNEVMSFGAMDFDNHYQQVSLRGAVEYRIAPELLFRAGPDILYYPYDVDIRAPQPPREGEPDPGPYSDRPQLTLSKRSSFSAPAGFAEAEWTPVPTIKVLLGGRADYFNVNEQWTFSPRLNARYDVIPGYPRTTLKWGIGLFHQQPDPIEVIEPYGTPSIHGTRSVHYSAGIEQELARNIDVSVEGFYKRLDGIPEAVYTQAGQQQEANIGSGRVAGAETLLRYKSDGRLFGWVAYTLSRATRSEGPGIEQHLYQYDQTHNVTVVGSYQLGRGWTLGGRFRYVSGNLYTPCDGGVLNAAAGAYACRTGAPFSVRLAAFHQLDVRADKTWSFEDWKLTAYLDVQNVYNRQNPEAVEYSYNYAQSQVSAGLPIIPSFGVRGEL